MNLRLTILLGVTLGSLPLHAQFRPGHLYSLTAAQVARSLSRAFAARGIEISDSQVSLPANVVASEPQPKLEVRAIEPLGRLTSNLTGEVSSAVKLVCTQPHTCVPFYAIVTLPSGVSTPDHGIASSLHAATLAIKQTPVQYAIRAGAHAALLMEDGSSHIKLEVVALENGQTGHTIRVSSIDHKQFYKAEVVSAGLLKGTF